MLLHAESPQADDSGAPCGPLCTRWMCPQWCCHRCHCPGPGLPVAWRTVGISTRWDAHTPEDLPAQVGALHTLVPVPRPGMQALFAQAAGMALPEQPMAAAASALSVDIPADHVSCTALQQLAVHGSQPSPPSPMPCRNICSRCGTLRCFRISIGHSLHVCATCIQGAESPDQPMVPCGVECEHCGRRCGFLRTELGRCQHECLCMDAALSASVVATSVPAEEDDDEDFG